MKVKEFKKMINALPECYDDDIVIVTVGEKDFKVVGFQDTTMMGVWQIDASEYESNPIDYFNEIY